jgi:hypothetical protein
MVKQFILPALAGILFAVGCADYELLENPPTPVELTIDGVTDSSVTLQWTPTKDDYFHHYTVYYSKRATYDSTDRAADTISAIATTTATVSGLDSTTRYYFRVTVTNEYGLTSASTMVNTVTLKSPHAALRLLRPDSVTESSARIRWEKSWHGGFNRYEICIDTINDVDSMATPRFRILLEQADDTSYTMRSLRHATRYFVKVHIVADNRYVTSSNLDSLTTLDGHPIKVTMRAIDSTTTDTSVTLTWRRSHDSDFSRYIVCYDTILRGLDSIKEFDPDHIVSVAAIDDTVRTITGLDSLQTYYFNVYVEDTSGLATAGTTDSITTVDGRPAKVSMRAIDSTATDTSVTLKWYRNHDSDFSRYIVCYDTKRLGLDSIEIFDPEVVHLVFVAANSDTVRTITRLLPSQQYFFCVYVEDRSGNRIASTIDSAATTSGIPDTVQFATVKAAITDSSLTVTWGKSSAPDFLHYVIVTDTTRQRLALDTIMSRDSTKLILTGLVPDSMYRFNVSVVDQKKNASFSLPDSARTLKRFPAAVESLTVVTDSATASSIMLTWKPYSGKEFRRFAIYYDTQEISSETVPAFAPKYTTSTRYNVTGLTGATKYYFAVYVENTFKTLSVMKTTDATTK